MTKKICPIEWVDVPKKQVIEFDNKPIEQNPSTSSSNVLVPYQPLKVIEFINPSRADEYEENLKSLFSNCHNGCNFPQNTAHTNLNIIEYGSPYYIGNDGYYFEKKTDKFIKMTNFIIFDIEQCIIHQINGIETLNFNVKLIDSNRQVYIINSIPIEHFRDLFRIIGRQYPQLAINTADVPKAYDRFAYLASTILRNYKINVKNFYAFWGWSTSIYPYGNRKFYHGGLSECYSHKKLLSHIDNIDHKQILNDAFGIIEVGSFPVLSILFTYAAAAYMDALFSDSGYPLSHSIMLIGSTGVMKTSLVKVLFSPFEEQSKKIYSVRGTEASFQVLHEKCFDDILVVDDFNREGSKNAFQNKLDVIEGLIRTYADKTPKSKYGGNDNIKQYAIRGGLVITSEIQMSNAIESAEFRYFKLHLENKLNGELLSIYQQKPDIIKYFFSEFIRFLEQNYIAIVKYIKANFQVFRQNYSVIGKERLIDICVHLMMAQIIIQEFLKQNKIYTCLESKIFLNKFEKNLVEILKKQNTEIKNQTPAMRYLKTVWHLLESGQIHLAPNAETYYANKAQYIGYIKKNNLNPHNDVYMFDHHALYRTVVESLKYEEPLLMSVEDISREFKSLGLTECEKDSCLKRSYCKGYDRAWLLAFIKSACEGILD